MKRWLIDHNFIKDKEGLAEMDAAFNDPDESVWDKYYAEYQRDMKKMNWWVNTSLGDWRMFYTGGDEHMRKDYVFGIPFGPKVVIPSRRGMQIYKENENYYTITFETDTSIGQVHTDKEFDGKRGVEVEYNDHGEVMFVWIDVAVLENNYRNERP